MNHMASKPKDDKKPHSSGGTVASLTGLPYFSLSSFSQTQVLIS
jgi:hypothetical protein